MDRTNFNTGFQVTYSSVKNGIYDDIGDKLNMSNTNYNEKCFIKLYL